MGTTVRMNDPRIHEVIAWWRASSQEWFAASPDFDAAFRERYAKLYDKAMIGDLSAWMASSDGCLALLILLDQYPRNAFRGTTRMYRSDGQALSVAHHALVQGFISCVPRDLQLFMLLPFAHSEAPEDQAVSVALHRRFLPSGVPRAMRHQAVIARFGRFPHRVSIFDRPLTPEECHYLNSGGFQG